LQVPNQLRQGHLLPEDNVVDGRLAHFPDRQRLPRVGVL
jgi:hypothetical protein